MQSGISGQSVKNAPGGIFQPRPGSLQTLRSGISQCDRWLSSMSLCGNGAYSIPASAGVTFRIVHALRVICRTSESMFSLQSGHFQLKAGHVALKVVRSVPMGSSVAQRSGVIPVAAGIAQKDGCQVGQAHPLALYAHRILYGHNWRRQKRMFSLPRGFFSPPGRTEDLRSCAQCPNGWFAGGVGASSYLVSLRDTGPAIKFLKSEAGAVIRGEACGSGMERA